MTKQNINLFQTIARKTLMAATIFIAASAIGYLFHYLAFHDTNVVVVYLLSVLIITWLTSSFVFGFLASALATFSFNYFFAVPHYSFAVNDPNYMITFITMTITALVTSALTSYAKQSALAAQDKEAETKTIYNLTHYLTGAKDLHDIAAITVRAISNCFSCAAACLCFDESGMPEQIFIQQTSEGEQVKRQTTDLQIIREMCKDLEEAHKDYYIGAEFYEWPIYGSDNILGVIRIPKEKAQVMNESQTRFLRTMIENTALSMDRFHAAMQRMRSSEEIVKERYRANLLRSISHDLRTPLAGIIGMSEMLTDMTTQDDPRYDLVGSIRRDANWLYSLVENILTLTRLQDGKLLLKKQQEVLEEVIGEAVNHMAKRSADRDIKVSVPQEVLLVPMDAKLIEQVIINLLDNAVKHTKQGNEISIVAELSRNANIVILKVKDGGTGIRESDLPHIFQMFYTSDAKHADVGYGIGLGLAICESIVKAHGGNIEAHNRTDGQGAEFIFTLPMGEEKND